MFNGIIERGCEEVQNNVLVFTREIENVKVKIEADKDIAWRFIDVDGENKIDEPAQDLLQKLKNKIREHVPKNNIFEFKVSNLLDCKIGLFSESTKRPKFSSRLDGPTVLESA